MPDVIITTRAGAIYRMASCRSVRDTRAYRLNTQRLIAPPLRDIFQI